MWICSKGPMAGQPPELPRRAGMAGWQMGNEFAWEGMWIASVHDVDGRFLRRTRWKNGITNSGIEDNLAVAFVAGGQHTQWFSGVILAITGSLLAADTMASHSGWTEWTDYSEANRVQYLPGTPAARSIINSSVMVFTAINPVTVKGAFLTTGSGKGGTTGVLWGHGQFGTDQTLAALQTLRLQYKLTGASA